MEFARAVALPLLVALPAARGPALAAVPTPAQGVDLAAPPIPLPESIHEAPVAPWQVELLGLAFDAASQLPLDPHHKNRAEFQAAVVDAWLALGQPRRALACASVIPNWRRAAGYADVAAWCARHAGVEVGSLIELAAELADHPAEENPQEWQRDRVRVKLAAAHAWLGHAAAAAQLEAGVVDSEAGKVDAVRAEEFEPEPVESFLARVDAVVAAGSFDPIRAVLAACLADVARHWQDAERRERVVAKMRESWQKLPNDVRIDLLAGLAEEALAHGDPARALAWVDEAEAILGRGRVAPERRIATVARLAALRHRAGATAPARAALDALLLEYEDARETIVDIRRARALLAVAEAYHAAGDPVMAIAVCRRALDEAIVNPNSRPRAEDFVAACCLLARRGLEPDDALREQLRAVRGKLGAPW